jgi:hypothetical protein
MEELSLCLAGGLMHLPDAAAVSEDLADHFHEDRPLLEPEGKGQGAEEIDFFVGEG